MKSFRDMKGGSSELTGRTSWISVWRCKLLGLSDFRVSKSAELVGVFGVLGFGLAIRPLQ